MGTGGANINNKNEDKIKRIIRNLKKEEIRITCGRLKVDNISFPLVWDRFFELKRPYKGRAKYNLDQLMTMNEDKFEQVIIEYFDSILQRFYRPPDTSDLYPILNIPRNSDIETVKKQFRELAKIMHPDAGGSHEDFIALYKAYKDIIKNAKSE